jgi:hypothetical protein
MTLEEAVKDEFDPFAMEDKEPKNFLAIGNTTRGTSST